MATSRSAPIKLDQATRVRDLLGERLRGDLNVLLDAPEAGDLTVAAMEWHSARVAVHDAKDALDLAAVEVKVPIHALDKPALRLQYPRESIDRLHDLHLEVVHAARAENVAKKRLDLAASALLAKPEVRMWLASECDRVADEYDALRDRFEANETRLHWVTETLVMRDQPSTARDAARGRPQGEWRAFPNHGRGTARAVAREIRARLEPDVSAVSA